MKIKSLLAGPKYPWADPKIWLFAESNCDFDIDPNFAGRLAALTQLIFTSPPMYRKHIGAWVYPWAKKAYFTSGYRSYNKQAELYKKSGGRQDAKGNWFGGSGMAAKPGKSWHNYGLAVDVSWRSLWLKKLEQYEMTMNQDMLRRFGLYKPLTWGNNTSVIENWHIQPIELSTLTTDEKLKYRQHYMSEYKKGGKP